MGDGQRVPGIARRLGGATRCSPSSDLSLAGLRASHRRASSRPYAAAVRSNTVQSERVDPASRRPSRRRHTNPGGSRASKGTGDGPPQATPRWRKVHRRFCARESTAAEGRPSPWVGRRRAYRRARPSKAQSARSEREAGPAIGPAPRGVPCVYGNADSRASAISGSRTPAQAGTSATGRPPRSRRSPGSTARALRRAAPAPRGPGRSP